MHPIVKCFIYLQWLTLRKMILRQKIPKKKCSTYAQYLKTALILTINYIKRKTRFITETNKQTKKKHQTEIALFTCSSTSIGCRMYTLAFMKQTKTRWHAQNCIPNRKVCERQRQRKRVSIKTHGNGNNNNHNLSHSTSK